EDRAALIDGRPVAVVEAGLTAAWEGARAQAEASAEAAQQAGRVDAERQAQSEQAASARAEAELEASQTRERLATALAEASLDEAGVRARLAHDPREVDSWRRELSTLDASRAELSAICAERTRKRQEHEEREPPRLGADAAQEALGAAERRRRETEALLQGVHLRLSRDDEDREKAAALTKELEAQRGQMEVWQTLAELIGSASGNKLRVFAQSLTLELLLDHANHHLRDLAPRYSLSRVPGEDLALQVVDHEMGDEVRAASSLSGGESFLVALGLALGLASLSARKASVGSLFIDEGFGALDPASLEMVLSSLDALQATGRQVGLISHVPTIAERFDTRVQVVAAGPARSRVEVVVGF
ncbi:MAG: SbcC/MukB-like Walker B domain-containing protein, partial [Sandaracinaceae bacterium]